MSCVLTDAAQHSFDVDQKGYRTNIFASVLPPFDHVKKTGHQLP
ncbi:hypothetical protein JL2886_01359 [Phaeobacter gallaeciensis]|uniref:Uncharacterized protein n=1 Tax=Phaeobacter gallaeciensis TaxID=60890 RepID=A0A1B0ZQ34_9RHOB|nr:hypothetical protein JL2886_01359 [Phaeobacter gallaeciensis]